MTEDNIPFTHDIETSDDAFINPYLPKMRTNYAPSDEGAESATGVDFPINMPNPAKDAVVVNNIASQEFDYTQDMLSEAGDNDKE